MPVPIHPLRNRQVCSERYLATATRSDSSVLNAGCARRASQYSSAREEPRRGCLACCADGQPGRRCEEAGNGEAARLSDWSAVMSPHLNRVLCGAPWTSACFTDRRRWSPSACLLGGPGTVCVRRWMHSVAEVVFLHRHQLLDTKSQIWQEAACPRCLKNPSILLRCSVRIRFCTDKCTTKYGALYQAAAPEWSRVPGPSDWILARGAYRSPSSCTSKTIWWCSGRKVPEQEFIRSSLLYMHKATQNSLQAHSNAFYELAVATWPHSSLAQQTAHLNQPLHDLVDEPAVARDGREPPLGLATSVCIASASSWAGRGQASAPYDGEAGDDDQDLGLLPYIYTLHCLQGCRQLILSLWGRG